MNYTFEELIHKLFKYFTEGIIISLVFYLIFDKNRDFESIMIIGITAASSLAIIDLFAPNISHYVRQGAGVGIGYGITRPDIALPIPPI